MSIVGTRPPLIGEVSEYELHHRARLAINFNTQFIEILPNTGTSSRNQSICFLVYLVEMFSVADSSQVFWLIIILFLKYNSLERLK